MSMKSFIGLSLAWPLAIAAVVVFGVAWCAMGAAYCKANPAVRGREPASVPCTGVVR